MKMGKSVFETFEQTVENAGDKTALIFLGEKYAYRFLKKASERLATAFVNLGIKKGDKFIIYTQNCPQWMVTWLGLQRIGAVPVPVSPIYTIHDLEYIASDSGAVGMLSADTNFGYAKKLKEKGIIDTLIVSNVGDMLPWWKRVIGKGFDRIPDGKVEEENIIRFKTLLKTLLIWFC